jgi:hypothetical protein
MKKQIFLLASLILLAASCKKDNDLSKSIFIHDPEFTELPAYSEWGYNTFGAYYDREIFVSNNNAVPVKVIATDSSFTFMLSGQKSELGHYFYDYHYSYYYNAKPMKMTFDLPGFLPSTYQDLVNLNDVTFDLKNSKCKVMVSFDNISYPAVILSGELHFKRAQNLQVDMDQVEVILSGYFELRASINNEFISISDGRFDLGVSTENFFKN